METYLFLTVTTGMILILAIGILWDENKRLKADKQAWKNRYYAAAQIQLQKQEGRK